MFFERVIHDNLDLGRPKNVQLIFDRRIQKNTPSRFRTRVMTQGVVPSLWMDYKSSTIKQYFKQGRALRTETTVNNTRDFDIGRSIENLPALRKMAQAANRRLLGVQRLDHDPAIGQDRFDALTRPTQVEGQRASGLKFGDPTVIALCSALLMFRLLVRGFSHKDLRSHVAQFLARTPGEFTSGQMTYHLRRLRLKGLIARMGRTNRYQATSDGLQAAILYLGGMSQVLRPIAAQLNANPQLSERITSQVGPIIVDACLPAA